MKFLLSYFIGIQIIAFVLFFIDKQKAKRNKWRIPEKTLFLVAFLGGSIGAILGMKMFRHKTKHLTFTIGLPLILIIQVILIIATVWGINAMVISSTSDQIVEVDEVDASIEYVIVLGASVYSDGTPSSMLQDRLDTVVEIYNVNPTVNVIVSGYCSDEYYDEVTSMKAYLLENGILEENIIEDYYGFSTYDSIFNLVDVYDIDNVIVVTQEYHMYRALYIANKMGIEAYGVCCQNIVYDGQLQRDVREILARCKDVVLTIVDLNTYLRSVYF